MRSRNKNNILVFIFLFLCGLAFGAWGMIVPPNGVIDGSVLILIAQIFVLAASVYGFEVHFDIKEGKFDAGKNTQTTGTDSESGSEDNIA